MVKLNRLAYFGHDSSDAAIIRRVASLKACGLQVHGFMMKRFDGPDPDWENISLGQTKNAAYLDRVLSVFKGTFRAARHKASLRDVDFILARNMDMLATAFLTKLLIGSKAPVIYECLDIHRLLCRSDFIGKVMRFIEGKLVARTTAVWVSSPAFLTHHFERHYRGQYRAFLLENRLPAAFARKIARPAKSTINRHADTGPIRLGWVGILRCKRSLDLMKRIADALGDKVEIKIHGKLGVWTETEFREAIAPHGNITFYGAYQAPRDLTQIYGGLDLIWSGDFMEAGFNSVWLLPNRIYEGGYFAVPAIAPAGTQTAAWISEKNAGFLVEEPLEESLVQLLEDLSEQKSLIAERQNELLSAPDTDLVEPTGFIQHLIVRAFDHGESLLSARNVYLREADEV